jgi:hypothetical protein
MYFRLVNHYPATGKANELRLLLEDRVRSETASGSSRSALLTEILGLEPVLIHAIQHENFAAWESHVSRIALDAKFQETAARMQSVMSRPQTQELHNVLVRFTTDRAANYLWSNTFFPVPGKAPELRRLLEERANTSTGRGSAAATLLSQMYPPDGANFMLAIAFSDLASLEAYQVAVQTEPSYPNWSTALTSVLGRPNRQRILRVLVPFPAP